MPSPDPFDVPVALFIFNRPHTTVRLMGVLAEIHPREVLIVADGPRAEHPEDIELCREARAVAENVDWPCNLVTNYSAVNMGCKRRLATGLDWVFSKVDEAVILEDDCLPERAFFPFCRELLERYRNDERVWMVRGSNFLHGKEWGPSSYFFSRFFHIWGWASWSRAWKHYDPEMSSWSQARASGWLESRIPRHMVPIVRRIYDETHSGKLATWEFQWQFSAWRHDGLAVAPFANMITNIGFAKDATNLTDPNHAYAKLPTRAVHFPLRHPSVVDVSPRAQDVEWMNTFPGEQGGLRRAINAFRRLIP